MTSETEKKLRLAALKYKPLPSGTAETLSTLHLLRNLRTVSEVAIFPCFIIIHDRKGGKGRLKGIEGDFYMSVTRAPTTEIKAAAWFGSFKEAEAFRKTRTEKYMGKRTKVLRLSFEMI